LDDGFGGLLLTGLEGLLAALIALGLVRIGTAQYAVVAPHDAEFVPMLHVFALVTGVCLGAALLVSVPHAAAFLPSRIFNARSPWNLSLDGFLINYALPEQATFGRMLAAVEGEGGALRVAICRLTAGLLLLGPAAALRWWSDWRSRLRAVSAFLLLAGYAGFLINYLAHLAAWTAFQLNFWMFLVALLWFQRRRYGPAGAGHR
jgi:hypothetical protein